jgi:cystathionine gamma-synthase
MIIKSSPLGKAIPPVPHAVSVSLPTWEDVYGYENKDPRVMQALEAGYPRFVPVPNILALEKRSLAVGGEICFRFFPSRFASDHALAFLKLQGVEPEILKNIHIEVIPRRPEVRWSFTPKDKTRLGKALKLFFQHTGEGLSSRQALSLLEGHPYKKPDPHKISAILKDLGKNLGLDDTAGQLFPSGMSAWFSVLCWLKARLPGKIILQYGFAYIDTLALPPKLGIPQTLVDERDPRAWEKIRSLLSHGSIGAIFVEYPTNPLLFTADLQRLRELSLEHNVPLVIDDSLSSFSNFDFSHLADLWLSSLTKVYNGQGNLMAGALFGNPKTQWGQDYLSYSQNYPATPLHHEDLDVLYQNATGWEERVEAANALGAQVAAFLETHPMVAQVYYPSSQSGSPLGPGKSLRNAPEPRIEPRLEKGWGGLLSFSLRQGEKGAAAFYDEVNLPKGPSFGTEFPLLCPYALLAYFDELDWVKGQGVDPYLMRLWVGTGDAEELITELSRALGKLGSAKPGDQ